MQTLVAPYAETSNGDYLFIVSKELVPYIIEFMAEAGYTLILEKKLDV